MIFFTADQHFDHENAIEYCNRPFDKLHKMNHTIINNFNMVVTKDDLTYHLGDFTLRGPENWSMIKGWIKKLNGKHILILGNHDKLNPFLYVECGFQSVHTYLELNIIRSMLFSDNLKLNLVHDPVLANVALNERWLCGHSHNFFRKRYNVLNVGVDVSNFHPISMIEVDKIFEEGEDNI